MPANGRNRHPRAISVAIAATLALATAGIAGAASNSVHVKITKKAISITGSRSATGDVVQLNYDPHKCATFAVENKRSTQFSDFRGTSAGSFKYTIERSGLHLSKPLPHYVCAYLIVLKGSSFVQLASASSKLS
jgi:hypothetical protein